jgi:archaellum biogenesis ATPase FlaH
MSEMLSLELLKKATEALNAPTECDQAPNVLSGPRAWAGVDDVTRSLAGMPLENAGEIAKLKAALGHLSANAGRGNGRLFDSAENPVEDYWLGVVWAIRSLGWLCGEAIAREWSQTITSGVYCEEGFRKAWDAYDPLHSKPVTVRSLYKLASALGWQEAQYANTLSNLASAGNQSKYQLLSAIDIAQLPAISWRLKGIFPETGLCAIFGPSGSGKSFLAFDLGATIAQGEEWFFVKTSVTEVVYILLEGEAGLKHRVEAWEKGRSKKLPTNFRFLIQPMHLMTPGDVEELINALPMQAVIFVDTLNRAAPTADENSSRDMGQILEAASRIARSTKGLVILVHHTGKDQGRGMRGHSSLFAALDGCIEVSRDAAGNRSWSVAKSKDGEDGTATRFKLVSHDLGKDADGEEIRSCTVERDISQPFAPRMPKGKNQLSAFKAVKLLIENSPDHGKCQSGPSTLCVRVDDAIDAVANQLLTTEANKRRHTAKKVIDNLKDQAYFSGGIDSSGEAWLWLA